MTEQSVIPEPLGGWREPWPRVFEVANTLPRDRWALVGGLMVQAHALVAGVQTNRVTIDVDAAVRVEAGAFSYAEAASALGRLGYALDDSPRLTFHFIRGADIVDLMVPDHQKPIPRHARRQVMAVVGGHQAMDRLQLMRVHVGDAQVMVPVPTLHGALILKSAAHMVDSRDRDRHLLDAITLLACIIDVGPIAGDLRGSDRKRLHYLVRAIDERPLVSAQAPPDTLVLAKRTLEELRGALS